VAARMETLAAPVPGGEERHRHFRPVGHARAPVLVAGELISPAVLVEVAAVCAELFFGQGRRGRHPPPLWTAPVSAASPPARAAHTGAEKPRPAERPEDRAVMAGAAVVVGRAPPDADGPRVRRLEPRPLPLVHRVVRDTVEPDFPAAPRLPGRPLDAVVEIL